MAETHAHHAAPSNPAGTAAPTGKKLPFNETAMAIGASLVLSLVLSWVVFGSPLRATALAYIDYSHTPAEGADLSSNTNAPMTAPQVDAAENNKNEKPAVK